MPKVEGAYTVIAWIQRYALVGLAVLLALSVAAAVTQTVRLGIAETEHAEDRAEWADAKTEAAETYAANLTKSKDEGDRRVKAIADIATAQARITAAAEARAARESAAVGGLRDRASVLASAASTCTADSTAAAKRAADRLAEAVSRLGEAGRIVAATGDRAINRGLGAETAYDSLTGAKP